MQIRRSRSKKCWEYELRVCSEYKSKGSSIELNQGKKTLAYATDSRYFRVRQIQKRLIYVIYFLFYDWDTYVNTV